MLNKKLHVKKYGYGKPLILLHGWGWHSGVWNTFLPQLLNSFEVWCVDLPGFGYSPLVTPSYHIQEVAQEILSVVPVENAHWLGWSLGGMIAWWIALHHPERVERLVTIASSPCFVATADWPGVSEHTLDKFKQLLLQDTQKTLSDFLELQLRGSVNHDEWFALLKNQLFVEQLIPSHETLLSSLSLLKTLDLRSELHKIQCPSLHIFGSNDTLVPYRVADLVGESVVIKRSGHMPFLTHADVVASYIL